MPTHTPAKRAANRKKAKKKGTKTIRQILKK